MKWMLLLQGTTAPKIPIILPETKEKQWLLRISELSLQWPFCGTELSFKSLFPWFLLLQQWLWGIIVWICLFRWVGVFFLKPCCSMGLSCGSGRILWCRIDECSPGLWIKLMWDLWLVLSPIIPAFSRILKRTNEFKTKPPPTTQFLFHFLNVQLIVDRDFLGGLGWGCKLSFCGFVLHAGKILPDFSKVTTVNHFRKARKYPSNDSTERNNQD